MPICIKYQDKNNNILGVDTSEWTIRGVQNAGNSSSNWGIRWGIRFAESIVS